MIAMPRGIKSTCPGCPPALRRTLACAKARWLLLLLIAAPLVAPLAAAEVARFIWSPLPPEFDATEPIAVTITAVDGAGEVVTEFTNRVHLSAFVGSERSSSLLISEVGVGSDTVKCVNSSAEVLDASGWQLVFYDGNSWPAPVARFVLPPGTQMPSAGSFSVAESAQPGGAYPSFQLGTILHWGYEQSQPAARQVAVVLLDRDQRVQDAVLVGRALPGEIREPVPLNAEDWQGESLPLPGVVRLSIPPFRRVGWRNTRSQADWIQVNPPGLSPPVLLQLPFREGRPLAVAPTQSDTFHDGRWSGRLQLLEPAAPLVLVARDSQGHAGASESLHPCLPGDLGVALEAFPAHFGSSAPDAHYVTAVSNRGGTTASNVVLEVAPFAGSELGSWWVSQGAAEPFFDAHGFSVVGVRAILGELPAHTQATLVIRLSRTPSANTPLLRQARVTHRAADSGYDNNVVLLQHEVARPSLPQQARVAHWWRAEGNPEDAAGTNRAALQAGATYGNGRVGRGFYLPAGPGTAVTIADHPSLNAAPGEPLVFETWLRLPGSAPDGTLVLVAKESGRSGADDTNRVGWALLVRDGRLGVRVSDQDPATPPFEVMDTWSGTDLRDGLWHHVGFVLMRGSGTPWQNSLYLDGAAVAELPDDQEAGSLACAAPLRFGVERSDVSWSVDEPALWRAPLLAANYEMAQLVQAGPVGKRHNLLSLHGAGGLALVGSAGRPLRAYLRLWHRGPDPVEASFRGFVEGPSLVSASVSRGTVERADDGAAAFSGRFGRLASNELVTVQLTLLATNPLVAGRLFLHTQPEMVGHAGGATVSLTVLPDTDGDGLPDWWESQFGLNPGRPGRCPGGSGR